MATAEAPSGSEATPTNPELGEAAEHARLEAAALEAQTKEDGALEQVLAGHGADLSPEGLPKLIAALQALPAGVRGRPARPQDPDAPRQHRRTQSPPAE